MEEKKINIDLELESKAELEKKKKGKGKKGILDEKDVFNSKFKKSDIDLGSKEVHKTTIDIKNEMQLTKINAKKAIDEIKRNLDAKLKKLTEDLSYFNELETYKKKQEDKYLEQVNALKKAQKELEDRAKKLNDLIKQTTDQKLEFDKKHADSLKNINVESEEIKQVGKELEQSKKDMIKVLDKNSEETAIKDKLTDEELKKSAKLRKLNDTRVKGAKYTTIENVDFSVESINNNVETKARKKNKPLKKIVKSNIYDVTRESLLQEDLHSERVVLGEREAISIGTLLSPELRKEKVEIIQDEPEFVRELSAPDQRLYHDLNNSFSERSNSFQSRETLNSFTKETIEVDSARKKWLLSNKYANEEDFKK